jgi:hypothetical protein
MARLLVCSAVGNRILRLSGFFFAAAGAGLFIYLAVTTWGYASRLDYLFGLVLLATAAAGVFLAIVCRKPGSQASRQGTKTFLVKR